MPLKCAYEISSRIVSYFNILIEKDLIIQEIWEKEYNLSLSLQI